MKKLRAIYYILTSSSFYYFTTDKKDYYTQDSNRLTMTQANEILINVSGAINEELIDQASENTLESFKSLLN